MCTGLTCALVTETCWPLTKVRSLRFCSTFFRFSSILSRCEFGYKVFIICWESAAVLSKIHFFPKISREIPTHLHKSGDWTQGHSTKDQARVSSTKMGINIPPDQLVLCHFCLRAPFSWIKGPFFHSDQKSSKRYQKLEGFQAIFQRPLM